MLAPRIAIGPNFAPFAVDAVRRGGGIPVSIDDPADAAVWLDAKDVAGLAALLDREPAIRWVQLPFAGVENFVSSSICTDQHQWTCAKGSYAEPVAEHALLLALAGLRHLPARIRATSWGSQAGRSMYDADVAILGGGGIATSLVSLLAPFRARATVVRRTGAALAGAAQVVTPDRLYDAIAGALVVFVALALTPETTGIIDAKALGHMKSDAWLVNVARGRHVVTGDLVEALDQGSIAGAALDVTDPEPLPNGHPLWSRDNCIITPHTADTPEMVERMLADRIARNTALFARGETLEGTIDITAGY